MPVCLLARRTNVMATLSACWKHSGKPKLQRVSSKRNWCKTRRQRFCFSCIRRGWSRNEIGSKKTATLWGRVSSKGRDRVEGGKCRFGLVSLSHRLPVEATSSDERRTTSSTSQWSTSTRSATKDGMWQRSVAALPRITCSSDMYGAYVCHTTRAAGLQSTN